MRILGMRELGIRYNCIYVHSLSTLSAHQHASRQTYLFDQLVKRLVVEFCVVAVLLQCCCSVVAVLLQCRCSVVAVLLTWC